MHTTRIEACKEAQEIDLGQFGAALILKFVFLQNSQDELLECFAVPALLAPLQQACILLNQQISLVNPTPERENTLIMTRNWMTYLFISSRHVCILILLSIPSYLCILHHAVCNAVAIVVRHRCASSVAMFQRVMQLIVFLSIQGTQPELLKEINHWEGQVVCDAFLCLISLFSNWLRGADLEEHESAVLPENGAQSLVFPAKAQAHKTIPFPEIHVLRCRPWLYADHTAVYLWWRPKVVAADLHAPEACGTNLDHSCSILEMTLTVLILSMPSIRHTFSRWETFARS